MYMFVKRGGRGRHPSLARCCQVVSSVQFLWMGRSHAGYSGTASLEGIIEMIWWTDLAPWEFEFPFPCSLLSTFPCSLISTHSLLWVEG